MISNRPFVKNGLDLAAWNKYVYESYPDWYEESYKFMWPVRLIYYPDNRIKNTQFLEFNFNKTKTIKQLKHQFQELVKCQHLCIYNLFGQDIGNIIISNLPDVPNVENNYLYIHVHVDENLRGEKNCIYRLQIPDYFTLPMINGALSKYPQLSRYTILRFRSVHTNPLPILAHNLKFG